MANNTAKVAHVQILLEGKKARNVLDTLRLGVESLKKQLEDLERLGVGPDDKEYQRLTKQLKSAQSELKQNEKELLTISDIIKDLGSQNLKTLQNALKRIRKEMSLTAADSPKMKELVKQYQQIDNQIGKITGQWKRQDGAILSVVKRLTAYVSMYGSFNFISGLLQNVLQKNLEFSDSLADIQKTTGLSAKGVAELSSEIMKIDTRTSVEELHKLAYEAGKLGIGSEGVEGVAGFVRAADKISVALGEELGGAEAIKELMKMNDVLGLTQKMGIEKSLMATGSAINLLGQSTTANADYIADFTRRMAGIGAQAHISIADLMAFGAAADSTGQELEVAATAMNLFITQLQTHYKTVSRAADVDENLIKSLLEVGKTTEAVMLVLRGLSQKGGLSQLGPVMKDLGSEGQRMSSVLANFASNIDKIEHVLMISNKGFEEAISVTNEYNIKNENAAAIMEKMANSWEKMFVNSQNTGLVKDMADNFYELSKSLQESSVWMNSVYAILWGLQKLISTLIAALPVLITLFTLKGIVVGIGRLAAFVKEAKAAATAMTVLNTAMKSNVIISVISLVVGLTFSLVNLKREISEAEKSANDLSDSFRKFSKDSNAAGIEANTLFGRLKTLKEGTSERRDLIIKINDLYGKYLPHLLREKATLEEINDAQDKVNKSLAKSIAYRAKESAVQRVGEQYTNKLAEQLSDLQNVYSAAGSTNLGEIDSAKIAELTAKYYDAGAKWISARNQIWQDMYGPKGISRNLIDNKVFVARMDEAQRAINNYVAYYYNQQQALENINKKYDPIIGEYKPTIEEEGPYKITEAEKESEAKRRQREQLKFAQDERDAVMAAIKIYYSQQRQVINDNYLQQKITAEQHEKELTAIQTRENETRIQALKKLHGDKDEKWSEELLLLSKDDIAKTDASQKALKNLTSKNLDDIREKLQRFGEGEMDAIWSSLEEYKIKNQEILIDLQQEIEKILLKKDYTGQVERNYQSQLEKLGLFFTAYEEGIKEGMENASGEMLLGMRKLANAAAGEGMKKLYDVSKQLYAIDINSADGQKKFKQLLSEQGVFGEQMLKLEGDKLKALYYKTLEYGDATTQAIKKQREEQLKIAAERFAPRQRELETQDKGYEGAVKFRQAEQSIGLATDTMVEDMEVAMYRQRLEAAQEYYDYLATHGYDVEEQRMVVEQAAADLSEKMVDQVKNRLSTYKDYFDAFEEMGDNFTFEGGEEGLEARQEAFENFVKEMGNLTKELIMNWVKEKIEHALIRAAMARTEETTQAGMTATIAQQQAVQKALVIGGETEMAAAKAAIGQQALATEKAQAAESVTTSASETAAKVPLGIAAGAAETIASLGFWGIPLVAVISAVLGALLNTAMSAVSNLFGGSEKATTPATTATKLVTGMLTYDSGNVQSVAGSGGTVSVAADDGHTYNAHVAPALPGGVGVVNSPLATLVNGQPAIVGERGPEIVIGRETTRAIMQYRPDLLQGLISYDKHFSNGVGRYRAHDSGNIQSFAPAQSGNGGMTNEEMAGLLREVSSAISQNAEVNAALTRKMSNLKAQIVRKEMVDETVDEISFRRDRGSDKKINRLFGKK